MTAKELRIGNWVRVGEIESTVDAIIYENFRVHLTGNALFNRIDQISGIPLTPEVLEKCGFVNTHGSSYYSIARFNLEYTSDKTFWFDTYRNREFEVESLHQLQNLYFALTGQELEITN